MQKILTNLSKFLILAVLSCSLLIMWEGSHLQLSTGAEVSTVTLANEIDSLWSSISNEFTLDHQVKSERVQKEIRKLLADQDELYRILRAAAPYLHFIYQKTREYGLPAEIALIPFIESEFNPFDHSSAGATGLWQLMPGTARELGVKVKSGYDGRRNLIASTKAALAYFRDLGNEFGGDWYLAIAAYNCGQGKVASVERRTGNQDYWELPLPLETKLYVPKLLAVAEIVENPKKYGVELPPISNEPYFAEVKVEKPVNLEKVAENTGVSIKTLTKLNPDYKNSVVPKEAAKTLLVPADKAPIVKTQLMQKKDELSAKTTPAVKPKKTKAVKKKKHKKKKVVKRRKHR